MDRCINIVNLGNGIFGVTIGDDLINDNCTDYEAVALKEQLEIIDDEMFRRVIEDFGLTA